VKDARGAGCYHETMRGYGLLSLVVAACSTAPLNSGNTTFGTVSSVTSAETGDPSTGDSATTSSEGDTVDSSDPTLGPETSAGPSDDSGESDSSATDDSGDASTSAESTGVATEGSSEGGSTDSGPMETTGGPDPLLCSDGDLGGALGYGIATGSTGAAIDDLAISCAGGGGVDVIYLWTAPAAGTYTFDLAGSTYDTGLGLFDPACDAAEIACNDDSIGATSSLTVDLGAGQQVLLSIEGYFGASGNYVLNVNAGGALDISCADAGYLGSATGNVASGSTAGADDNWTASCPFTDGPDVSFAWTAPAAAMYTFSLIGSSYDTVLTLWSPACGGAEIACNDDSGGLQSSLVAALGAGQTVLVVVDGYNDTSGAYTLAIN
jgi:hypothetical protein